ncbi:jg14294 [Pararge aegeria aegeria]|uniref:Jg14294 protein n=1 Tax=Pararge aegeria aegeria TaxID=348720 RepID=A0A8S4R932_9NEOP|nr:jg14294 [Pararge aegeria aegeria]
MVAAIDYEQIIPLGDAAVVWALAREHAAAGVVRDLERVFWRRRERASRLQERQQPASPCVSNPASRIGNVKRFFRSQIVQAVAKVVMIK